MSGAGVPQFSSMSDYSLDEWGSTPQHAQRLFPVASLYTAALRPTQPPIQREP
jgi:hypothetical protein